MVVRKFDPGRQLGYIRRSKHPPSFKPSEIEAVLSLGMVLSRPTRPPK